MSFRVRERRQAHRLQENVGDLQEHPRFFAVGSTILARLHPLGFPPPIVASFNFSIWFFLIHNRHDFYDLHHPFLLRAA